MDLDGARVLDLYAGSGALGLEAASRGATRVVWVDSSTKALPVLRTNVARLEKALGSGLTADVFSQQALTYCRSLRAGEKFNLVMIDPPYDTGNDDVLDCLVALIDHLTPDAIVAVERGKKTPEPLWPDGYDVLKKKTYGDTAVFYFSPRR